MISRRKSTEVIVGGIGIGGDNPVRIQSMTNTRTEDVSATVEQIISLAEAGSELVRITVNTREAAEAVPKIKESLLRRNILVPLIGDFHFNGHVLLREFPGCAEALDKYRINPGNSRREKGGKTGFQEIVEIAVAHNKPIRIGVNWGSLDQAVLTRLMDLNAKKKNPTSDREVLLEAVEDSLFESVFEARNYGQWNSQIILSAKLSSVSDVVKVNERIAGRCDYPIHLGLTEAGPGVEGVIASTAALSILLQKGIGDTIRASLTPDPHEPRTAEVSLCKSVLQSLGLRQFAPKLSACPGCGRSNNDFYLGLAGKIDNYIRLRSPEWSKKFPGSEKLNFAVMGCVVNGPGESKHADVGISLPGGGEAPQARVFVDGVFFKFLDGDSIAENFIGIVEEYIKKRFSQ